MSPCQDLRGKTLRCFKGRCLVGSSNIGKEDWAKLIPCGFLTATKVGFSFLAGETKMARVQTCSWMPNWVNSGGILKIMFGVLSILFLVILIPQQLKSLGSQPR